MTCPPRCGDSTTSRHHHEAEPNAYAGESSSTSTIATPSERRGTFSLVGVSLLMGLVGKNAILLVDYTHTLRKRGESRLEALLEAGPTRLPPSS
jgi:hypothetical protein